MICFMSHVDHTKKESTTKGERLINMSFKIPQGRKVYKVESIS